MKQKKAIVAIILSIALVLVSLPMFAAVTDTDFTDVDANAWYAQAVTYCQDEGIMMGTTQTEFKPELFMSRAMLATVLWRAEGSPGEQIQPAYEDVTSGQWYSNAIAWATKQEIVTGYSPLVFGTNDPITREQIATILYRYAAYQGEAVEVTAQLDFADTAAISSWASTAVLWAREAGVVTGRAGNVFDPQGNATRAEVAAILFRYLSLASQPDNSGKEESNILIAYFSRTKNTQALAEHIESVTGGDLFEIQTIQPYPTDYDDCLAQASQELEADARPALATHVDNMDGYDVIFVGYPIWHGNTPMAIRSFLEEYDFSGKALILFCTHGGSGLAQSVAAIKVLCPDSEILDGLAVTGASAANALDTVSSWIDGLDLGIGNANQGNDETNANNQTTKNQGSQNNGQNGTTQSDMPQLRLDIGNTEIMVTMYDNPTSRDFLTLLPLTLPFKDYNRTEKVSNLPRELSLQGAPQGFDPDVGDLALYAPWGNLAIYYQDFTYSSGLIPLGHMDSGIETLANMDGEFSIEITVAE